MTNAQERKKQERQARRRRIQQAAREIFARNGYAKTSIEQVAQRASLSVGAIYLYFRSKEDLYLSLLEEPLEALTSQLEEIGAHTTPSPLAVAWTRLIEWAGQDTDSAIILRSLAQNEVRNRLSNEVAEALTRSLDRVSQVLEALLRGGIDSGAYRPVDTAQISGLVWSLFLGLLQASDIRRHLGLTGSTSALASANAACELIEAGLRQHTQRVAEAA
ncbi:MAG: TetR/AcrR family transcriptional regulator [Myxococcota bacterium]